MNYESITTAELELSENQIMSLLNNLTDEEFLKFVNEQKKLRDITITGRKLLDTIDHRGVHMVYDEDIINYTTDLETFSFKKFNREINQKKVDEICKTIEEYGIIVPIIVDKNLEVCEGQHRVKALMKYNENNLNNKKGIHFVIRKEVTSDTIKVMNRTSTNWKPQDYLHSYVETGFPEYIKFQNFNKKNQEFSIYFNAAMCQNDLSGIDRHGGKTNVNHKTQESPKDKFEKGIWKVAYDDPNLERAQRYADNIKKVIKVFNFKKQHFNYALLNLIMNVPQFDLNRLIDKFQENYLFFNKVKIYTREQAYELINEVYNKKLKKSEEELRIVDYYKNKKKKKNK